MNERELTLIERVGCALCEDMAIEVQRRLAHSGVRLKRVNIDEDPQLLARYDWEVPLLFAGEVEICRHRLNIKAFNEWIAGK